jgi:methionyl-tRNA formyltransferase
MSPSRVKSAALDLGCPILQPETLKTAAFRDDIEELAPDAFVVVAYGRILGPRLLALAPHGAINVHFSLLPRWRGASPVQRAILAGDEITGVSIIRLVADLDAGPVLARAEVSIEPGEHAPSLESRLAVVGASLLLETLDALETGRAVETPQDPAGVALAPPLDKDEGWLDPRESAITLERRVRAFDPWPGARLRFERGVVSVVDAVAVDDGACDAAPGVVLSPRGDGLPIACAEGLLLLRTVKPEGRGAMTGRSLVNGRFVAPGDAVLTRRVPAS